MRTATTSALAIVGVLICTTPALTQAPVALVEEVRGNPAGVEVMDYVTAGKVVRLRPQELIVLGYLTSCWHETITGGTVIVASEQSEVRGGKVTRTKVPCNGGRISLTPGQANQSAGSSFRAVDPESPTLYGLFPVVEAPGGAALLIVRVDRAGRTSRCGDAGEARHAAIIFRLCQSQKDAHGGRHLSGQHRPAADRLQGRSWRQGTGVPIISRLLRFPASR